MVENCGKFGTILIITIKVSACNYAILFETFDIFFLDHTEGNVCDISHAFYYRKNRKH